MKEHVFKTAPESKIIHESTEGLSKFLVEEPQKDGDGNFRYLLTGGLAVEVVTGVSRDHHDIDIILLDRENRWWVKYPIDYYNWGKMNVDDAYLESTAWIAKFQVNSVVHRIAAVHPAIILVQKLSNFYGMPPRKKDIEDIESLVKF